MAEVVHAADDNIHPNHWMAALDLLRKDEHSLESKQSLGSAVLEGESRNSDESDYDLAVDLAKAALEAGTTAFSAGEWHEASLLLQEALDGCYRLPAHQRSLCDLYALYYRLAICAFHTLDPPYAEQALAGLIQQQDGAESDEHRQYRYDAAHCLAILYIRTGQIDRALSQCERALQGRRRLLGKQSELALQSTALMAHIYLLLNNRARAKAFMAMIPEARRADIQQVVAASLNTEVQHESASPSASILHPAPSDGSSMPSPRARDPDTESLYSMYMDSRCDGPVSSTMALRQAPNLRIPGTQPSSPRSSYQRTYSDVNGFDRMSATTTTSATSASSASTRRPSNVIPTRGQADRVNYATQADTRGPPVPEKHDSIQPIATSKPKPLSRMELAKNLRCLPADRIEEAVCNNDLPALTYLLQKKKSGFLRSKMQKALYSKRVTALHFAALFGDVEMARRLIAAGFDVNEIPELSVTRQTPLKFAVGARRVDMVTFLVESNAKPTAPDSWATLAGQLMDRSWLTNTMSVAEKEDLKHAPACMIAIMNLWIRKGWDVNAPCDISGRTVLHQAIAFESGFYKWDASLRSTLTRYLCDQGADPLKSDAKGNTPYDMAKVAEDRDLLSLLEQKLNGTRRDTKAALTVELPAEGMSPVELFATPAQKRFQDHQYRWNPQSLG